MCYLYIANRIINCFYFSAIQKFCGPEFTVPVSGLEFKITSENGMCSFGVGNVGTYNSTFTKRNVIDQAYDNPAGFFNYTELIDQAKSQTYVIIDLFSNTEIPRSVFSVFLPNEVFPTIDFLSAPPPVNPIATISSSLYSSSSITPIYSSSSITPIYSSSSITPVTSYAAQTMINPASAVIQIPVSTKQATEVSVMTSTIFTSATKATSSDVLVPTPTELQLQAGSGSVVTSSQLVLLACSLIVMLLIMDAALY